MPAPTRSSLTPAPGIFLVQAGTEGAELGRHVAPPIFQGDDGDDGDEGQEEAVLHHAGATLAVGVELGLDPGLEHEKVHCSSSCGAPEAPASPLIWRLRRRSIK